ncbi:hypothetical protein [Micromonospora sp. NPDC001898]|uniref:hypothetical protein n=1 Tax=Micromonospora sp. NPDC001898 TaxID=3364221 RepID=UPI003697B980
MGQAGHLTELDEDSIQKSHEMEALPSPAGAGQPRRGTARAARVGAARTVARLRARIAEVTTQLLDELAEADEVDLLAASPGPLPITLICELPGVRVEDRNETRGAFRIPTGRGEEACVSTVSRLAPYGAGRWRGVSPGQVDDAIHLHNSAGRRGEPVGTWVSNTSLC